MTRRWGGCFCSRSSVVALALLVALDVGSLFRGADAVFFVDREAASVVVFRFLGLRLVGILAQRRLRNYASVTGSLDPVVAVSLHVAIGAEGIFVAKLE